MVQAAIFLLTVLADGREPDAAAIERAKDLLVSAAVRGNEMAATMLQAFPGSK
jgi:hypothetical protein